jgi:ElaB/YqjD/DUF883 family membrane-anchored ribosome-binding protein
MGRASNKKKKPKKNPKDLPFVSICTPTYNRRPFISHMIKCFEHQDYPKDKLEWIIIDDGTDKIEELVTHIPQVKYYKYDTKMTLGKKRNLMHDKTKGDILVYMDDDDYYPPDRISHAVERLMSHPDAICAGSSEIYIYFKHIQKVYQFGPYSPTHATAGTFAFKRKLLSMSRYNEEASLAEEKEFLKDYTIPFVQLDPMKTILVFSHIQNTFDKKRLLENPNPQFCKESFKTVNMFVKNPEIRDFYMNQIEKLLEDYEPGDPKMKPDVLSQIARMDKERAEEAAKHSGNSTIMAEDENGKQIQLSNQQVIEIIQNLQNENNELKKGIQSQNQQLQEIVKQANDKIQEIVNECNQRLNQTKTQIDNLEKENTVYKASQKKQLLEKNNHYINFDKEENIQINICEKSISNEVKEELENKMKINGQYCNNDNCAELTKNSEEMCDKCLADE